MHTKIATGSRAPRTSLVTPRFATPQFAHHGHTLRKRILRNARKRWKVDATLIDAVSKLHADPGKKTDAALREWIESKQGGSNADGERALQKILRLSLELYGAGKPASGTKARPIVL